MTITLESINCAFYLEQEDDVNIEVPSEQQFSDWITLIFNALNVNNSELSILVCSEETIQDLNLRFRGKDKATNVLSFPSEVEHEKRWLGDIAICAKVVDNESKEQNKHPMSHWAHMTIHGCLHLLGFDHIDDDEADEMEALEIKLLSELNIANPYLIS